MLTQQAEVQTHILYPCTHCTQTASVAPRRCEQGWVSHLGITGSPRSSESLHWFKLEQGEI